SFQAEHRLNLPPVYRRPSSLFHVKRSPRLPRSSALHLRVSRGTSVRVSDQAAQQANTGSSRYESIATCRGNALMPQRYLMSAHLPGLLRSMHMASVVLNAGYTNLNSSMVPDANRI